MKKITFMLSLLMSMGAMTTSAQVLSRAGWTITTSSECDDSDYGHAAAIIDGNNNSFWHSNWAVIMLRVIRQRECLNSSK